MQSTTQRVYVLEPTGSQSGYPNYLVCMGRFPVKVRSSLIVPTIATLWSVHA